MRRLAAFGDVVVDHQATYDRLHVAGIELIYLDEWDSPCLIASDAAGHSLLHDVFDFQEGAAKIAATPEADPAMIAKRSGSRVWRRRQT